jgi:hypothetical protein
MKILMSNPFATFMILASVVACALTILDLMKTAREGGGHVGAVRRPSGRRSAGPASRTSSEFARTGAPQTPDGRELVQISQTVETWIDPETGKSSGRVVAGVYRGRSLDTLSRTDCLRLNEYCLLNDAEAMRLLDAYGKDRFRSASRAKSPEPELRRRVYVEGPMTRQHAFEVLGLPTDANERQVVKAHRALLEKTSASHGGGGAAVALIDQAKALLLEKWA